MDLPVPYLMGKGKTIAVEVVSLHVLVDGYFREIARGKTVDFEGFAQTVQRDDVDVQLEIDDGLNRDRNLPGRIVPFQEILSITAYFLKT